MLKIVSSLEKSNAAFEESLVKTEGKYCSGKTIMAYKKGRHLLVELHIEN